MAAPTPSRRPGVGGVELVLPGHLTADQRELLVALAQRRQAEHGPALLALVLSGSAGRGLATGDSDLDVHVVLAADAPAGRGTGAPTVDEAVVSIDDLESVPGFGSRGWWSRWSYAWAPVLLDRTGGRLGPALQRQATLTAEEVDAVLLDHLRLDGWLNYAYRALKADRRGRTLACRLDAAEGVPWLLDVVFALAGRVRPYHGYLAWELTQHPLRDWPAEVLLARLVGLLDGDPAAVRDLLDRTESSCARYDAVCGHRRTREVFDAWGDDLARLRR